jgi:hypothetical protein
MASAFGAVRGHPDRRHRRLRWLGSGQLRLRPSAAGGGVLQPIASIGEPLGGLLRDAARLVAAAGPVERARLGELVLDEGGLELLEGGLRALAVEARRIEGVVMPHRRRDESPPLAAFSRSLKRACMGPSSRAWAFIASASTLPGCFSSSAADAATASAQRSSFTALRASSSDRSTLVKRYTLVVATAPSSKSAEAELFLVRPRFSHPAPSSTRRIAMVARMTPPLATIPPAGFANRSCH